MRRTGGPRGRGRGVSPPAPPRVAVKSGLRGPHARAIAHARRRATVHTLRTGCTHTV